MPPTDAFDPVARPAHYASSGIETIDYIRDKMLTTEFVAYCRGNALKYLSRAGGKGDEAQDFAKAAWYAQMAAHALDPDRYDDPRPPSAPVLVVSHAAA